MKKNLIILFTLLVLIVGAFSMASVCYADEIAESETIIEEAPSVWEQVCQWFKGVWARGKEAIALTGGTILGAVVLAGVKYITNKGFEKIDKKINTSSIADETTKKLLNNLSNCVMSVDIQPLMAKQYAELQSELEYEMKEMFKKQDERNLALIECIEGFADYFKCSSAVSDEQKKALEEKIASAKALYEGDKAVTATIEVKAEATSTNSKKANTTTVQAY